MNFPRLGLGLVFVLLMGVATAAAVFAQAGTLQPNDEIPQPLRTVAPAPTPTPSAGPRRGRRAAPEPSGSPSAGPSDTPEPPQFTTLDGIWEVELQPLGKKLATYSHLSIDVSGQTISGYYEHLPGRTKSTLTGTFDGRLITLNVNMADGTTAQFSGYVENFADMVGLFRTSEKDPGTAFTAQHRKKQKA